MKDFSGITTESGKRKWYFLMDAINSGEKIKVDKTIFNHFLEALPPKKMFANGFIFQEGSDPKIFTEEDDGCYCEKITTPAQLKKAKRLKWT